MQQSKLEEIQLRGDSDPSPPLQNQNNDLVKFDRQFVLYMTTATMVLKFRAAGQDKL